METGTRTPVDPGRVVLGLDTATGAVSVALWRDGRIVAHRREVLERGHAEALFPMLQAVLDEGNQPLSGIDRLGVTVGPGAFTGLRVGISAARGLALATGKPLYGVSTFDTVAAAVHSERGRDSFLLVVIESKRAELFVATYDGSGVPIGRPRSVEPADLVRDLPPGPIMVAGDGAVHLRSHLVSRPDVVVREQGPDATCVAQLVAAAPGPAGDRPVPLYLRDPDVRLSAPSV